MSCFECGSPVKVCSPQGRTVGLCANPSCPGLCEFFVCGYCRQLSFAAAEGRHYCVNKVCAAYRRRRLTCSTCTKLAVMVVARGVERCLQPTCPTAAGLVEACPACGHVRFFSHSDIQFCVKGGGVCKEVFRRKERCFHCQRFTYDIGRLRCESATCKYKGVPLSLCPACGKVSYGEEGRCQRPSCGGEDGVETILTPIVLPLPGRGAAQPPLSLPPVTQQAQGADSLGGWDETVRRSSSGQGAARSPAPQPASSRPISWGATRFTGDPPAKAPAASAAASPPPPAAPSAPPVGSAPPPALEPFEAFPPPRPDAGDSLIRKTAPWKPPALDTPVAPDGVTSPAPASTTPEPRVDIKSATPTPSPEASDSIDAGSGVHPRLEEGGWVALDPEDLDAGSGLGSVPCEDEQAAPVAREPAEVAPRAPVEDIREGETDIRQVYAFLEERYGKDSPLVLLVGLPGVGKSSYLTVLGEIIRNSAHYHTPYAELTSKPVGCDDLAKQFVLWKGGDGQDAARFRELVRDLVFDFADKNYRHYLSRGLWMQATLRTDHTLLLAEIGRGERPIARLVTVDAPGEIYQRIFRNALSMERIQRRASAPDPLTRTVARLLDSAHGLLLLVPANVKEDRVYANFLEALCLVLYPRAMQALRAEVKALADEPGALDRLQARRVTREECSTFLEQLQRGKDAVANAPQAVAAVKKIAQVVAHLRPDLRAELKRRTRCQQEPLRVVLEELRLAARVCLEDEGVLDALARERKGRAQRKATEEELARAIMADRGASDLQLDLQAPPPPPGFDNLRHLHFALTKCDMYPVPSDPEEFPRKHMPHCADALRRLKGCLGLLGGGLRFYASSVAGHSIVRGARAYPGEAALTPINVIEPVFDMLKLPRRGGEAR